jgi:hypothetical protein
MGAGETFSGRVVQATHSRMPAVLTKMSIGPKCFSSPWTIALHVGVLHVNAKRDADAERSDAATALAYNSNARIWS